MAQSRRFWVIAFAAVFGGVTGGLMAWLGHWSIWAAAAGGALWAVLAMVLLMVFGFTSLEE